MKALQRSCAWVIVSILSSSVATLASADTICVDGHRYENVLVRESGTRYYFWIPAEGRTLSCPKDHAKDVSFTADSKERDKLIEEWNEWEAHRQERAASSSSINSTATPPPSVKKETAVTGALGAPQEATVAGGTPEERRSVSADPTDIGPQVFISAYVHHHDSIRGLTAQYNQTVSSHSQLYGQLAGASGKSDISHEEVFSLDFATGRYVHTDHQWKPAQGQTRSSAQFSVRLWDGESFYQYTAGKKPRGVIDRAGGAIAREALAHPLMSMCRNFAGGPLMGYPIQAELRFDRFLGDAQLTLHPQSSPVGHFQCRVVEGTTRFGHVSAWFAPEDRNYSLVKYTILQGAGDTYRSASITVTIDELQQVDGLWLPKSGHMTEDWRFLDGGVILRDTAVQLKSIDINPDFNAKRTFDLAQHVPNGSVWSYLDNQGGSVRLVNGQFVQ